MIPPYLLGDVLVFDLETALLGDKAIEIGFSLFRNAELVREWGTFINPQMLIDPEASKVNNITDADVEDAPTFSDVAAIIYNGLKAADVIVAYNACYDLGVLDKEFARVSMELPKKPVVDPFIFYKKWHKFAKGKKLVNAAEAYGIPYLGAHRAVADATVTGKLLFKMAATKPDFPKDVGILVKKQRQLVQDQFEDLQAYFIKIGKGNITPPEYKYYE